MNQKQDMISASRRVANWNAARYDRVYDRDLAMRLLHEELDEFFEGSTEVERLDGLLDTMYVAFGVLWKLNLEDKQMDECYQRALSFVDALPNNMLVYAAYAKACVHSIGYGAPAGNMAFNIIVLCMAEAMDSLFMTYDEVIRGLHIVCDSNDSKSIKKVAANVKANDGDKGDLFAPPEPRLQELLNKRISTSLQLR